MVGRSWSMTAMETDHQSGQSLMRGRLGPKKGLQSGGKALRLSSKSA